MKKLIVLITLAFFSAGLFGAGAQNTLNNNSSGVNQPLPANMAQGQPTQSVSQPATMTSQATVQSTTITSQPAQTATTAAAQQKSQTYQDTSNMTDEEMYSSVTSSADFTYRPVYKAISITPRDLFQDIKVSAVESIPFSVAYTFLGIAIYEAIKQQQIPPTLQSVNYYRTPILIAASCFAFVNVAVNVLTYYKYNKTEEKKNAPVKKEK